ncbi:glycosyltransferase [Maribacter sp. X9]|uniref:glycosyltransferase n=1 Tax=Maribacter sp. X9 TaxID=3402159 RepID=UPI003AF3F203
MKKLLFDLIATQPSPEARFHGGGQYAKMIFLKAIEQGFKDFDCVYNPNIELGADIKIACKLYTINLIPVNHVEEVEKVIQQGNYDAFYSSLPYQYLNIKIGKTIFIMDVLGLREIEMPKDKVERFYRKNLFSKLKLIIRNIFFEKNRFKKKEQKYRKLLEIRNKHILTISYHSKYSLLNFFPFLDSNDITVNYAPIDFSDFKKNSEEIKGDYFLLVSANRWIKNNHRAIIALDQLFSEGKLENKKVIVLGSSKVNSLKIKNSDKFIFKGYVGEEDLKIFYKNAYCFIYPSLNEGFGYPPIEAMKYKTPVLASAISAIPEICGNAVLYFNPFSIYEIRNRILQINEDKLIYANLQSKGIIRLEELQENQKLMITNLLKIIFQ